VIKISQKSIIYLLCPAMATTGGPEAVHQLCHKLRSDKYDARIVYFTKNPTLSDWTAEPGTWHQSITPLYAHYDIRVATEFEDHEENVVVTPELWPVSLSYARRSQKVIWWLAAPATVASILENYPGTAADLTHLCQSAFARHSLAAAGASKIGLLSDYTRPAYIRPYDPALKRQVVAFNPAKGMEYTSAILEEMPDVPVARLEKMTPEQVHETLARSMVYIDFGHHPGKDRIPREAAVAGCCIIVGRRGSANFYRDVPIPEEYKFSVDPLALRSVVTTIRRILDSYSAEIARFDFYRRAIAHEEQNFEDEVLRAFRR
jgi:hypothetical protein